MNFTLTRKSMKDFGDKYAQAETYGFEPSDSPYLVPVDEGYRFDNVDAMRLMTIAWAREWERKEGTHRKGILFFGPTGSGKTSLIEQFFARLNVPLLRVTWNPKREADEMLTDRILVDGMLLDRDQAITTAARQGLPVVINELDLADPAELVSLNDVIEKGLIVLPNGETIQAKRGFMVFATANTAGVDDEDGVYHGTRSQNASTLRRFYKICLGYPSVEDEVNFLKERFPHLKDSPLIEGVANVAVKIRQAFAGTSDAVQLSKPISRPETVDWLELIDAMRYLKGTSTNIVEYALSFVFTNGMSEGDRAAVKLILESVFVNNDLEAAP